ncbi:MAG: hypothetical protein LiPW16_151 [Microgenomates group bacterium LiPW_16]|nr:MAG: hypothetical protein LiPW16_151 [Microgenomates group bacterium LiPW_16]
MADRPLSPATRHRLGRPLPYQQADRTQAHSSARSYSLSSCELIQDYLVFRRAILDQRVDSYALLTRPPLSGLRRTDRLACLRHAASVHPEPGSNSQKLTSYHILIVKVQSANWRKPKSPTKSGFNPSINLVFAFRS